MDEALIEDCWKNLRSETPNGSVVLEAVGAFEGSNDPVFTQWLNTTGDDFWNWNATMVMLVLVEAGEELPTCLDN